MLRNTGGKTPLTMDSVDNSAEIYENTANIGSTNVSKSKGKMKPTISSSYLSILLINSVHVFMLLYMVLVIVLCFKEEFVFFTWHPFLLSVGWLFCMSEAILIFSRDNLLSKIPNISRVKIHWILLTTGTILSFIAFIIVIINKNNKNKNHFQTWHSIFGLIGIILAVIGCLTGLAVLYHKEIKNYVPPKINKLVHIALGLLGFGLGGVSLVLSVYTKWFSRRTDSSSFVFLIGIVATLIVVGVTSIKPVKSVYKRISKLA